MLFLLAASLAATALAGAGTLGPGDEQLATGEYFDRVTFSGVAGDEIVIELTSTDFDPYLIIIDASDTVLAQEDDSAGAGTGVRMVFRLPESDTYTVIITSFSPGESGGYALTLSAAGQASGTPVTPSTPTGALQPGTVTGTVVDTQGTPIAGAQVTLRPALTTGQADFRTDADGRYVAASLPDVPYYARAWTFVEYGGQQVCMRLGMDSDADYDSFTATNGAVRNFRMQLTGPIGDMRDAIDGHFGGAIYFFDAIDLADRGEQIEFTFTPTGPLIDGTMPEPFTRTLTTSDGNLVRGIPIGPYRLSAEVIEPGGTRRPMALALDSYGELAAAVDIDWTGENTCSLASGFNWVDVYSEYSR